MMTALSGAAAEIGSDVESFLDSFNETGRAEAAAELLLRAILQTAKADGEIDESERETILGSLGENTDPADAERVRAYLAAPLDIQGLADATPANRAVQVYSTSAMAITLGTPSEAIYLHGLAEALGLNEAIVNALHLQIGPRRSIASIDPWTRGQFSPQPGDPWQASHGNSEENKS